MRTLLAAVLAAGSIGVAGQASAWAIDMFERNPPLVAHITSDTVTVDVFLDAEPNLTIFSIGVLYDSSLLAYDGPASAALPASGAAGPGAQPSYILYAPGKPATYLVPLQTPYFLTFPAPPGVGQVNVNWVEVGFNEASATGNGIWVASLVFHVIMASLAPTEISLAFTSSNLIQTGTVVVDPNTVALSAPVVVNLPEASAAVMIGLVLVGLRAGGQLRRG